MTDLTFAERLALVEIHNARLSAEVKLDRDGLALLSENNRTLTHELAEFRQESNARFDSIEVRGAAIENRLGGIERTLEQYGTIFEQHGTILARHGTILTAIARQLGVDLPD